MECNILLVGVGGQGILTIAQVISQAVMRRGCYVKQSEVHGMSQRGGAVQAHLRFGDRPIHSDVIPLGRADLLLAVEPLEALRYTEYLNEQSTIVASTAPVCNIPDYPPLDEVLDRVSRLGRHILLDAPRLARVAGSPRAENMVMLGAALRFMDLGVEEIEPCVAELFAAKGDRVVEINRRGLYLGHRAAGLFHDAVQRGLTSREVRTWMDGLTPDQLAELTARDGTQNETPPIDPRLADDVSTAMREMLEAVQAEDRTQLFEHEVYRLIDLAGAITPPRHLFVRRGETLPPEALDAFPGEKVVLKIVSPEIVHKSDADGIAFVPKEPDAVRREVERLIRAQSKHGAPIAGVLIVEFVEHARHGLGAELFVGIRRTREFGPVIAAGLGGLDTEYLSTKLRPGIAIAKASALDTSPEDFFTLFKATAAYELLAGKIRGHKRLVEDGDLLRCFRAFIAIARAFAAPDGQAPCLEELEVNPFAFRRNHIVPLDGRGRLGPPVHRPCARPLEKVTRLLEPRSIAVVGVSSQRENFGRIILHNILECGFPRDRLYVVKPDVESVDGVRCFPTVADLPERADLLVAAISARHVPGLVDELLSLRSSDHGASAVILIPGGLGEKEGTQDVQEQLRQRIQEARRDNDHPPVFLGGNCMGVRSRPGRYDTFFIPKSKLDPHRDMPPKRFAIVSQSGAFIITRMSNLEFLEPQFAISVGNQVDLSVSDIVHALAERDDIDCIGVYVEGFNDLDGLAFLHAVEAATRAGKLVVFYKAGRTSAGRSAAQGHTASVAGDYDVCQAAVAAAGAIVTDTFKEFEQLVELGTDLHDKQVGGIRLGLISNAGYESVGMADTIRGPRYEVDVAGLCEATIKRISATLDTHGLGSLVNVGNPLDLTPMANDEVYEACARAMLDDPGVDAVIVGCVPMTPSLLTTPDELQQPGSIARRIPALFHETTKPLIFVVDCLAPYDVLARTVRRQGVPVFRSADQAVRSVGRYLAHCAGTVLRPAGVERHPRSGECAAATCVDESRMQEVGS